MNFDRSLWPGRVEIQQLPDGGPPGVETLAAPGNGAIHADPDDRAPDAALAQRRQHAGEDAAGPERGVDGGRLQLHRGNLVSQLETGPDIPETAQRRRAAHRDVVRRLAGGTQLVAQRVRMTFEIPMVVGVGEPDVGAHQVDGQQIPLEHPAVVAAQHERGAEPDPAGCRGGQTRMVALRAAAGDQNRRTGRPGLRHFVFELAWLVASERQVGQVVPFQVEVQAEPRASVRQPVERRRRTGQALARITGKCAVDGGLHEAMIACLDPSGQG